MWPVFLKDGQTRSVSGLSDFMVLHNVVDSRFCRIQRVHEFLVLGATGELFMYIRINLFYSRDRRAEGKKLRNSYLQKGARYVRSSIPRILGYSRTLAKPHIFVSVVPRSHRFS